MSVSKEFLPVTEERPKNSLIESVRSFPEIIADNPLENTTLVYSIPAMNEWKNGNMLRMLNGMFSQHPKSGESFEIQIITNIGPDLEDLINATNKSLRIKPELIQRQQKKVTDSLVESDTTVDFLKKIINAQRISRALLTSPSDKTALDQLNDILDSVSDPIQKKVIQLAIEKAKNINLTVVDTSRTTLKGTPYGRVSIGSLRTLGADITKARFEDKKDIIFHLYDADTVPENNHVVSDIQTIYAQNPELNFLFTGMSNFPSGSSKSFLSSGPGENIERSWAYSHTSIHGSPQISFRSKSYDLLQEISSWDLPGFRSCEDFDTSLRLTYCLGVLQKEVLLNSDIYPPTSLTADRLDGSFDSDLRRKQHEKQFRHKEITESLTEYLLALRKRIFDLINRQNPEKQEEIKLFLQKSEDHFLKKEKVQQRFNCLVMNTLIKALDSQFIKLDDGHLIVEPKQITTLNGGVALTHYIQSNQELIKEILSSPDDIETIKFYLGLTKNLPRNYSDHFRPAIREYLGKVLSLDELSKIGVIKMNSPSYYPHIIDLRPYSSLYSIMHPAIAEMMALRHTYNVFFETDDFFASNRYWPENSKDKKFDMHYGSQKRRIKKIKENQS